MSKTLIVGLCGSTINARRAAIEALKALEPEALDLTIPSNVRAPWRRGDALYEEFEATPAGHVVLCDIQCAEEADTIECFGGFVVHVEGVPSDDTAIKRDTLLLTMKPEDRGRYTTPVNTLAKLKAIKWQ